MIRSGCSGPELPVDRVERIHDRNAPWAGAPQDHNAGNDPLNQARLEIRTAIEDLVDGARVFLADQDVIFGVHVVDAALTVRDSADLRGLFGEGGHDVVDLVLDPDLQVAVRAVFFRHDSLTTVLAPRAHAGLGMSQETALGHGWPRRTTKERAARRLIHRGRKSR